MSDPTPIRLSEPEFTGLAAGGGDAEVVGRLRLANRSRTLLAVGFVAARTKRDGHRDAAEVERAYRVLAEVREVSQEAVWRVLDEPEVALWAVGAARELVHGGNRFPPALLANVAAAAAVRAGVAADLTVTRVPALPSLGTVVGADRRIRVRPDGDGCLVDAGGPGVRIPQDFSMPTPGWFPLPVARMGERTVTLDRWRLAALPEPFDTVLDRGPDTMAWSRVLSDAVDVLDRHGVADAVVEAVRTITPIRGTGADPSSATLSDAFGCVLLSLPRTGRLTALTLVHEVQHAKLTVVLDLFPLLETGAAERFYAPWRRDPRPLLGLLHGAYAYVGVVGFWRRQRLIDTDPGDVHEAEVEFARWLTATRETVDLLTERPELTPQGRRFVAGMAETLADWSAEPVSPAARSEAEHLRLEHRDRWSRAS